MISPRTHLRCLPRHVYRAAYGRRYSKLVPSWLQGDFKLWPAFLTEDEQAVLLKAALRKLDDNESRTMRRRRRDFLSSLESSMTGFSGGTSSFLTELFLPDEYYQFEEVRGTAAGARIRAHGTFVKGHFDGVIKRYREIHVSSWSADSLEPPLSHVLDHLRALHPSNTPTQTHVIHLASDGEILPHVDNIEASGSWIMGVSLGDERILRMAPVEGFTSAEPFEVSLPSGSVYLQRLVKIYLFSSHVTDLSSLGTLFAIGLNMLSCLLQIKTEVHQTHSASVS